MSPRVRGGTTVVCLVVLLGMVLLLIVSAYYPLAWDPPRTVRKT